MSPLLRALPEIARVSVARHVAYRSEMTIWILTSLLPLIMLALWNAVAADGPIAGFSQDDVARYFVATLVCRQLTGAWVIWELSYMIRMGTLSPQLLRPYPPLLVQAVWMLMAMPFRLAILSPVLIGLVAWRPDLFAWPSPQAMLLFPVSIGLAWLTNFLVQSAFGLLSFWVDKSDGLFGVWQAVWALLSGYVAPMAFFPDAWRAVLDWLPFRAMLAVPVELLGGFLDPAEAVGDVALQVLWVAVGLVLVNAMWTAGLRRYGAFGA